MLLLSMCSTTQSCKERKELLQQLRYRLLMVRSKLTGRFRNENATTVTMARTDLILAWPYPGFHDRFFSRVRLHDLVSAETGNRAWKVSGAQGSPVVERKVEQRKSCSVSSTLFLVLISRCVVVPIIGWFSNRTGTSFDDGKARRKD